MAEGLDPQVPFESDWQYVDFLTALILNRSAAQDLEINARGKVQTVQPLEGPLSARNEAVREHFESRELVQAMVQKLESALQSKLAASVAADRLLPRLERAVKAYGLDKKPAELFRFAVVTSLMSQSAYGIDFPSPLIAVRRCNATLDDFVALVQEDSALVKEGIFSEFSSASVIRSSLFVEERVLLALCGAKMRESDLMRLGETSTVRKILAEEGTASGGSAPGAPTDEQDLGESYAVITEGGVDVQAAADPSDAADTAASETETETMNASKAPSDVYDMMRLEREREREMKVQQTARGDSNDDAVSLSSLSQAEDPNASDRTPYATDLAYMDDVFRVVREMLKLAEMERRIKQQPEYRDLQAESSKRESQGMIKVLRNKIDSRLRATRDAGPWLPRLERLAAAKKLGEVEKWVLCILIFSVLDVSFRIYGNVGTVKDLLTLFCGESLQLFQEHQKIFYKSSVLCSEGIIHVDGGSHSTTILQASVRLDRRMLDYLAGCDVDISELVESSRLTSPQVDLERVVLPQDKKQLVVRSVANFLSFQKYLRQQAAAGRPVSATTNALTMLFCGPSGTGKTMLANALARNFDHKVLLVDYPTLVSLSGGFKGDNVFRMLFREAQLQQSIVFFDECEALFEARALGNNMIQDLLVEVERFNGIVVMATNRAVVLDEALFRRITITVQFDFPTPSLRKEIWKNHIPTEFKLDESVDLDVLAEKFALSGGFIKNSLTTILTEAVSRNPGQPTITMDDLMKGASLQLKGAISMKIVSSSSGTGALVPTFGLEVVLVDASTMAALREVVDFSKARSILSSQWGFDELSAGPMRVLLAGPSGCGKSIAAEALAFELGVPMVTIRGSTVNSSSNLLSLFASAMASDALVVIEDFDALGKHLEEVMHYVRTYRGVVVCMACASASTAHTTAREFEHVIRFGLPDASVRTKMFRAFVPRKVPLSADVNFDVLATSFDGLSGRQIRRAITRAAARAALKRPEQMQLTMADLQTACMDELKLTVSL